MVLLDLLRAIGKRPGFYLVAPPRMDGRSIWHLQTFLVGYQTGKNPRGEGDDILDEFTFWVCTRFGVADGPMNWTGHIWRHCGEDDVTAFDLFFELLEEYVKDREKLGPALIKERFMQMINRKDQS